MVIISKCPAITNVRRALPFAGGTSYISLTATIRGSHHIPPTDVLATSGIKKFSYSIPR